MTPVAKTGLHCGLDLHPATEEDKQRVTPVAKTGLHCGIDTTCRPGAPIQVTPVAKTGLHCGGLTADRTAVVEEE